VVEGVPEVGAVAVHQGDSCGGCSSCRADKKLLKFLWKQNEFYKNIMDGEEKTYGGCEGPDAMYVKLISSDDHEFIVKRDMH
jgi:transcription elongation factor B subunit 1